LASKTTAYASFRYQVRVRPYFLATGPGPQAAEAYYLSNLTQAEAAGHLFFAQAVLANGAAVDARPSDALNLAAVSNAPVYAAEELLEPHARAPAPTGTASTVTVSVRGTAPNNPGPAHQPPEPEPPDASTPAGPAN
jgi:hypothetical protein